MIERSLLCRKYHAYYYFLYLFLQEIVW